MVINGMSGTNTQAGQMGMSQTTDAYSRNIQNQIVNAQKQLQELSPDEEAAAAERTGKATEKKPAGEKEIKEAKEGKETKAEKETKAARTEKETEGQQAENGSHVDVCL